MVSLQQTSNELSVSISTLDMLVLALVAWETASDLLSYRSAFPPTTALTSLSGGHVGEEPRHMLECHSKEKVGNALIIIGGVAVRLQMINYLLRGGRRGRGRVPIEEAC